MDDKGKAPSQEKPVSSQVLEYYRTHSQNDKLTKYFCGSFDLQSLNTIPHVDENFDHNQTVDEDKADSPTSSIVLNRKLEWDNGADIGYNNCSKLLHKSTSLPVLNVMEGSKLQDSSGSNKSKGKTESLDSAELHEDVLKYLYEKLGLPIAESTPYPKSILKKTEILTKEITDFVKNVEGVEKAKGIVDNAMQTDDLLIESGSSEHKNAPVNLIKEISTQTSKLNPDLITQSSKLTKDDLRNIKKLLKDVKNKSNSSLDAKIKSHEKQSLYNISTSSSSKTSVKNYEAGTSSDSSSNYKKDQNTVPTSSSSNPEITPKHTPSSASSNDEIIKISYDSGYAKFLKDLSSSAKSSIDLDDNKVKTKAVLMQKSVKYKKKVNLNTANFYFEVKACKDIGKNPKITKVKSTSLPCLSSKITRNKPKPKVNLSKLQKTKPVSVECIQSNFRRDKITQTTLSNVSIGVQTTNLKKLTENTKVVYLSHRDSNNSSNSSNSELKISNSNSFEYLYNPLDLGNKENLNQPINTLKRSSLKEDLSILSDKSSSNDDQSHLSSLLNKPPAEVEKKLKLFQKLYKSKKYNDETKKYYLKKMFKEILRSNDDSSDVSEKITPKLEPKLPLKKFVVDNFIDDKLQGNVPWVPVINRPKIFDDYKLVTDENSMPKNSSSTGELQDLKYQKSSSSGDASKKSDSDKNYYRSKLSGIIDRLKCLHDKDDVDKDCPCTRSSTDLSNDNKIEAKIDVKSVFNPLDLLRQSSDKRKISEVTKSKESATKTDLPVQESNEVLSDHNDNNKNDIKTNAVDEQNYSNKVEDVQFSNYGSEASKSDRSSNDRLKSWREDKTITEQIHEDKVYKCKVLNCNDDLVTYAKKEREHQLSWINNEISHLEKLKNLLLLKSKSTTPESTISYKENTDKKTAIYMITTERVKGKDPKEKPEINVKVHDKIGSKNCKVTEIITTIPANNLELNVDPEKIEVKKVSNEDPKIDILEEKTSDDLKTMKNVRNLSEDSYTTVSDSNENNFRPSEIIGMKKYSNFSKAESTKTNYYPSEPSVIIGNAKDDKDILENRGDNRKLLGSEYTKSQDIYSTIKSIRDEPSQKVYCACQSQRKQCVCTDVLKQSKQPKCKQCAYSDKNHAQQPPKNKEEPKCKQCAFSLNNHAQQSSKNHEESKCKQCVYSYNRHAQKSSKKQQESHLKSCCSCHLTQSSSCNCNKNHKPHLSESSLGSKSPSIYCQKPKRKSHKPHPCYTIITPCGLTRKPSHYLGSRGNLSSTSSSCQTPSCVFKSSSKQSRKTLKTTLKKKTVFPVGKTKHSLYKFTPDKSHLKLGCKLRHAGLGKPTSWTKSTRTVTQGFEMDGGSNDIPDKLSTELKEAVIVSNEVTRSLVNPTGCVRRLVIELPLNSEKAEISMSNFNKDEKNHSNSNVDVKNIKSIAYSLSFQTADSKGRISKQNIKISKEIRKNTEQQKDPLEDINGLSKETIADSKADLKEITKTLQEYLSINRPNFVKAANERRKQMSELAETREKKYCRSIYEKQRLGEKSKKHNRKRLFTSKEMKTMATRKYRKLPEVQQKVYDRRKKQYYEANRYLAGIFKQKLKENVLRGNTDLSTSISVINMERK